MAGNPAKVVGETWCSMASPWGGGLKHVNQVSYIVNYIAYIVKKVA
jgi:hypothetical protein